MTAAARLITSCAITAHAGAGREPDRAAQRTPCRTRHPVRSDGTSPLARRASTSLSARQQCGASERKPATRRQDHHGEHEPVTRSGNTATARRNPSGGRHHRDDEPEPSAGRQHRDGEPEPSAGRQHRDGEPELSAGRQDHDDEPEPVARLSKAADTSPLHGWQCRGGRPFGRWWRYEPPLGQVGRWPPNCPQPPGDSAYGCLSNRSTSLEHYRFTGSREGAATARAGGVRRARAAGSRP